MPEIKWIKITTDMFDNRKIKRLRHLPDGDRIVLIWVMLLTMAGKCNAGGMIHLTSNIPYSVKMLSDELDIPEDTITLAIKAFEELNMVSTDAEGFLRIDGWDEYQSVDGMEKIRAQTRERVARCKQKKKEMALLESQNGNASGNATVTHPSISISSSLYDNSLSSNYSNSNEEDKDNRGVGEEEKGDAVLETNRSERFILCEKLHDAYPSHRTCPPGEILRAVAFLQMTNADITNATANATAWSQTNQWQDENGRYVPNIEKFLYNGMWKTKPNITTDRKKKPVTASGKLGAAELEAIEALMSS